MSSFFRKAIRHQSDSRHFNLTAGTDERAKFRYKLHSLPSDMQSTIGTSAILAAWNAATYVAQIEERRLEEAILDHAYVSATRDVLQQYGGLWFNDESYVISRKSL